MKGEREGVGREGEGGREVENESYVSILALPRDEERERVTK